MLRLVTLLSAGALLIQGPVAAAVPNALNPEDEAAKTKLLGECFTRKSTGEDRINLAKWVVAILASSPNVAGVAKLEPGLKDQLDVQTAKTFTRLFTQDCAAEARPLWQARSTAGFRVAGETLGRLAIQEAMSGPGVDAMFSGYAAKIDRAAFKILESKQD